MSKKLNDGAAGGADPTLSPEAIAEAERLRVENDAKERDDAGRKAADEAFKKAADLAAASAAAAIAAEEGLVTMIKGEVSLKVHPTCVEAHLVAGWAVHE